ncbi:MAG: hypothetical protein GXO90_11420 [FCB group bacterium]|nr:hypothetical protein [FCB group bacterium]
MRTLPKAISFTLMTIMGIAVASEPSVTAKPGPPFTTSFRLGKVGDYPFPTNPLNDRAKGYLIKGKVKSAVFNYGNFIQWGDYSASTGYNGLPAGMWGNYSYLPHVAFMAGVPGSNYSSNYTWTECGTTTDNSGNVIKVWCSQDAYTAWFRNGDTTFVSVAFETIDDRGILGEQKASKDDVDKMYQWGIDDQAGEIFISLLYNSVNEINPNSPRAYVGLVYPWGMRPVLKERSDSFDVFDYGPDQEEWTADDNYAYYGASTIESWFTRWSPSTNTEWQATTKARINSHDTEVTAGDIFGTTPFTDPGDPYPLLAHSNYSQTWPKRYNVETGEYEPYWPGWWAENYNVDLPGCTGTRKDPACWEDVPGRFISDTDVYLEFDDRWAERSNIVNTNNEYLQTGYPLGLKVRAEAHSYGVAYAEDILFVTVRVRNESGDWVDDNGVRHDGIILPDGTKLNHGKGFNYQKMVLGFYMDADVVSMDIYGNTGVHTNDDDFMEYYWERFDVNNESLLISMAMIYDYDGNSNGATDLGIVATQLLDSPLATRNIDLDKDGNIDIFPGEPLKMTDWHWFDWYNRPGVVTRESNTNCCAGEPGRPQALNREEIMYKLIAGDTTNLSDDEKAWFFHTPHPDTDLDIELNPHFDSLEGLEQEDAFIQDPPGLDCVLIMSCGPFDLDVGEEVPFSFCIIFGQDRQDLINNAKFAQIMYNSHYQGYTPPTTPTVTATVDHKKVTLTWDDAAEQATDVVTGYADFEGYKVYKSKDGGKTWGGPEDMIYDSSGVFVGWQPIAQFDLTAEEDSAHCVYVNPPESCTDGPIRGHSISGRDPLNPWVYLGDDTGLQHIFVDTNVVDGMEYTYSVTAYDMGVEAPYYIRYVDNGDGTYSEVRDSTTSNPNGWSEPTGYPMIENSKGTTIHDPNFVSVIPGYRTETTVNKVQVVPNPYIVRSQFNEREYVRRMRFTHLPETCTITIYTITGEKVNQLKHDDPVDGNEWWNMRTVNNQEIAPGLYFYTVESGSDKFIGKFAVVR